jgi:hypothetical protein
MAWVVNRVVRDQRRATSTVMACIPRALLALAPPHYHFAVGKDPGFWIKDAPFLHP